MDAPAVLRADPWRLIAVLPDATVAQADRLARELRPGVRRDDPRRGRALVRVDPGPVRQGRAHHVAAEPGRRAGCGRSGSTRSRRSAPPCCPAACCPGPRPDGGTDEPWMARKQLAEAETTIAEGLARLVRTAKTLAGERAVKGAVTELDEVQAGAVALAAAHGVSLLTGGPGTGKSRTVEAIVELCTEIEASIALAAPTGRAAKRLEELAGNAATTVHRLLGARPPDKGSTSVRVRPGRRQPDRGQGDRRRRDIHAGRRTRRGADRRDRRRDAPGDRRRPGAAAVDRTRAGARRPDRQRRAAGDRTAPSCTGRPRAAPSPGWPSRSGPATWPASTTPPTRW